MTPFMGAPQHPLLGAAGDYAFPMTTGLLGQPQDWTQVALGLAGNPHAGPYAGAQGLPAATGSAALQPGSRGSTGSQVASSLLGVLARNPSLIKGAGNAVSSLLGGGLGAYGSGAAADAAVASTLAPTVASELGTTASGIEAANDAALASQLSSEGIAPIASGAAPAASSAAAPAASGSLGAVGSLGLVAALAGLGLGKFGFENSSTNGWGVGDLNDMSNAIKQATNQYGLLNLNPAMGSSAQLDFNRYPTSGGMSPDESKAFDYLAQMQNPSAFGTLSAYDKQLLQGLGYSPMTTQPITMPSPDGRGWLGGGFTGASRA